MRTCERIPMLLWMKWRKKELLFFERGGVGVLEVERENGRL